MFKIKRCLSVVLAVLLLVQVFSACSESKTNTDEPTADPGTAADPVSAGDVPEETEPETQFMPDTLPDLDLGGETCRIFCWESWDFGEFFIEEDTGEIVVSAVFNRNLTVEDRLNVKLEWEQFPRQDAAYGSVMKNAVSKQNTSGDGTYDIIANYGMRVASCATDGMLMNLWEADHIDLSKPWYYASATSAGTLHKGYTYFTAGDLSYNALARMSGVFFNQGLITDFSLADPYELVLEGSWTIDKMHEMIVGTYRDLDGDGKCGQGDQYGVMCAGDQINTLYYGTGSHFIEHDEEGNPIISPDVYSERTLSILEKYLSLFAEDAAYKNPQTDVPAIFDEGRSIFYIYPLGHVAEAGLRESEIQYGFIPQPKVTDDEETYHASVTNAVTLFAIPLVIQSVERASAVFECLASEGYRQVSPVVFEQAYKAKYNYDESSRQTTIFDMIRANAVFDLGKIFSDDLFGGFSNGVLGSFIWNGKDNYASSIKGYERVWKKGLEKMGKHLDFGD